MSTVAEANPSLGLGASSTWAVYAAALASLALLLLCASGAFGAGAGDAPDDASLLPMSIRGRPHAPRRRGQRQPRALCASAAFYVGVALPLGVLLPLHWDLTATASWGATARRTFAERSRTLNTAACHTAMSYGTGSLTVA